MDSFTHALAIGLILYAMGMTDLIIWGVLGAVVLDIDVMLFPFSDPYPSLYIFTHGGITHSLFGALLVSAGAFLLFRHIFSVTFVQDRILSQMKVIREYIPRKCTSWAFPAVIAGAFLHLGLDCCASPGLPLMYPLSVQKYTLGILSGSSMILLAVSLIFVGFLIKGRITPRHIKVYGTLFLVVLLFGAGMKVYVSDATEGRIIPTLNPFYWLVIEENDTSYVIEDYGVLEGVTNQTVYQKYLDVSPAEADQYLSLPEIQRLRYFSYMMITEKNSGTIIFRDPLREEQIIWYPPYYSSVGITR